MKLKGILHTGLATNDLGRAKDFYVRAFGFELIFEEYGIAKEIASMTGLPGQTCSLAQMRCPVSGQLIELLQFHGYDTVKAPHPVVPMRPGQGHVAFDVMGLDAWIAKVEGLGAMLLGSVTTFPEGRSGYFVEPSGTYFELSEGDLPSQ